MILPTKRISSERALLTVGGEILAVLHGGRQTVSGIWVDLQRKRQDVHRLAPISYDWFVLALDLLFALGAIEWNDAMISGRERE